MDRKGIGEGWVEGEDGCRRGRGGELREHMFKTSAHVLVTQHDNRFELNGLAEPCLARYVLRQRNVARRSGTIRFDMGRDSRLTSIGKP